MSRWKARPGRLLARRCGGRRRRGVSPQRCGRRTPCAAPGRPPLPARLTPGATSGASEPIPSERPYAGMSGRRDRAANARRIASMPVVGRRGGNFSEILSTHKRHMACAGAAFSQHRRPPRGRRSNGRARTRPARPSGSGRLAPARVGDAWSGVRVAAATHCARGWAACRKFAETGADAATHRSPWSAPPPRWRRRGHGRPPQLPTRKHAPSAAGLQKKSRTSAATAAGCSMCR